MPGPKKQFATYIQLRITSELRDRIDKLRRTVTRSEWIREAVEQRAAREEKRHPKRATKRSYPT